MKFEIDVSGSDIFEENYSICIANVSDENHIIKGFKFKKSIINKLVENWKNNNYQYSTSEKGRGLFKVRLYCIVIHYLFKSIPEQKKVSLTICRDFFGHSNNINQNLRFLLGKVLGMDIGKPRHQKLPKESKAHWYAYIMFKDRASQFSNYIVISLKQFEKYLIKKVTSKDLTNES